jgi:hypothetical protein
MDGRRRVTQQRAQDKHGKYGQIYGDLSAANNRLISNVYFSLDDLGNWLLRRMKREVRCCADGADANIDSIRLLVPFPAATGGNSMPSF